MRLLKYLLIHVIFFTALFASGEELTPLEKAKEHYDAGRFTQALTILRSHQNKSAGYYYNLGNIYFRLGKIGAALAYYEKANIILPYRSDILHNLHLTQEKLSQSLKNNQLDPASTNIEVLSDNISLNDARKVIGLTALIVLLLWFKPYLKTRNLKKTLFQPAGYVGLFALFISIGVYAVQRYGQLNPPAICLRTAHIHSGPGAHFLDLGRLESGIKIRLLGASQKSSGNGGAGETWLQVRYDSDAVGWVKSSHLLLL